MSHLFPRIVPDGDFVIFEGKEAGTYQQAGAAWSADSNFGHADRTESATGNHNRNENSSSSRPIQARFTKIKDKFLTSYMYTCVLDSIPNIGNARVYNEYVVDTSSGITGSPTGAKGGIELEKIIVFPTLSAVPESASPDTAAKASLPSPAAAAATAKVEAGTGANLIPDILSAVVHKSLYIEKESLVYADIQGTLLGLIDSKLGQLIPAKDKVKSESELLLGQIVLVGSFLWASRASFKPPATSAAATNGGSFKGASSSPAATAAPSTPSMSLSTAPANEPPVKVPSFLEGTATSRNAGTGTGTGAGTGTGTGSKIGATGTARPGYLRHWLSHYKEMPALASTSRGKLFLTAAFSPLLMLYVSFLWACPDKLSGINLVTPGMDREDRMRYYREKRDWVIERMKGLFLDSGSERKSLQDTWGAIWGKLSTDTGTADAASSTADSGSSSDTGIDVALKDIHSIAQVRNKHIFQVANAMAKGGRDDARRSEDAGKGSSELSPSEPTSYFHITVEKVEEEEEERDDDDDDKYYNVYNCDVSEYMSPHRLWAGASTTDPFTWTRIKHACWTRPIQENILYNGIILRALLILPGVPTFLPMLLTSLVYMVHTADSPEKQIQTSWFPMSLEEYQVCVCMGL